MPTGYISPISHGYRSQTYRVGDGSESAPSYSFISDQDTGIYRPTLDIDGATAIENTIGVTTGAGDVFRINEAGEMVWVVPEAIIRGGAFGFGVSDYANENWNLYVADDGFVSVRYGLEVLDGPVSLPSGVITSAMIADGTIVNGDISASAAIATSKLADYADTTWTPVIAGDATAGSNTYSLQAGNYMRIGNLVIAQFFVTMTAKDGAMAGNIYVSLPVTVRNTSNMFFSGALRQSNITLTAGYTWLTLTPTPNTSRAFIQQSGTGVAVANIAAAGIAATTSVIGTVVYFA